MFHALNPRPHSKSDRLLAHPDETFFFFAHRVSSIFFKGCKAVAVEADFFSGAIATYRDRPGLRNVSQEDEVRISVLLSAALVTFKRLDVMLWTV